MQHASTEIDIKKGLPELIIPIFSHLPPVFLLTTIRAVCKQWKEIVETSPELRWITWTSYSDHPPLSLRNQYSNRNCELACGTNPERSKSRHDVCPDHAYSHLFELNPISLHLFQKVWSYSQLHAEQDKSVTQHLKTPLEYLEHKTKQIQYMQQKLYERHRIQHAESNHESQASEPISRMNSSNAIRPSNLASAMYIFPASASNIDGEIPLGFFSYPPNAKINDPYMGCYDPDEPEPEPELESPFTADILAKLLLNLLAEGSPQEWLVKCKPPATESEPEFQPTGQFQLIIHIIGLQWRRRVKWFSDEDLEALKYCDEVAFNSMGFPTHQEPDRENENKGGVENTDIRVRFEMEKPYGAVAVEEGVRLIRVHQQSCVDSYYSFSF
ncbi:hypothetical protein TWF694_006875 [Orbilia ellipsospora]|uniref:F-box domain-containing protein n=1 Tax=Orbilia ellipsospora TaxID=2528407 RepID=A0AAV9XMZ8_9PEZI